MQGKSLFVTFTKGFGSLFVDGLPQIGHQLSLNVYNVEAIRFRIFQPVGIFQQQSFCLYNKEWRVGNA